MTSSISWLYVILIELKVLFHWKTLAKSAIFVAKFNFWNFLCNFVLLWKLSWTILFMNFLRLKLIRKDKNSRWPFILAFSCLSSFILMASACLCGTPERSTSMRFLSRYWIFTLGLNTVYQVIETLINTLPGKIP